MFVTIIGCVIVIGILNAVLGNLFRQSQLSKSQYRMMAITINAVCIYVGQVVMGVAYNSPFAVILALVGGISIGFQVVNVIARIKAMEQTPQNKR